MYGDFSAKKDRLCTIYTYACMVLANPRCRYTILAKPIYTDLANLTKHAQSLLDHQFPHLLCGWDAEVAGQLFVEDVIQAKDGDVQLLSYNSKRKREACLVSVPLKILGCVAI